ncbi:hypothetical protein GCM10009682_14850 [Luedemannella flava]|uniref:Uncharacterized protein n=2 Tax=Luedemannella flava TaxID=349316 RepID=A0ABP4XZF1_9ACTN
MIGDLPVRVRAGLGVVAGIALLLAAAQVAAPWWPRPSTGSYAGPTHVVWALGQLGVVLLALAEWVRHREGLRWRAGLDLPEGQDRVLWDVHVGQMRRREGSTAVLLAAWGLVGLSAGLFASRSGVPLVWGYVAAGALVPALFAHAVLTFPDGRPAGRWHRLFLTAAYGSALLYLGYALTAEAGWIAPCGPGKCPANPLLLGSSLGWSWFTWWAQKVVAIGLVVWLGALLLNRLRTDPDWRRQALIRVLAAAAVPAVVFAWRLLLDAAYPAGDPMWTALRWSEVVADLAVPAAMLIGLRVSAATSVGTAESTTSVEEAAV